METNRVSEELDDTTKMTAYKLEELDSQYKDAHAVFIEHKVVCEMC